MNTIFTLGNETDENSSINLDDLYERKKQYDLNTLSIYNKLLNRIHNRIKTVARQQVDAQYCWYVVPEMILGIPKFDHGACTAYLIDKLQENKFNVRYIHPNTLFICWDHWVPSYVRTEIKKKMGVQVNEYGQIIEEQNEADDEEQVNYQSSNSIQQIKNSKKYTPINSYKPSGKLVYSEDLLNKIENKMN